MFRLIQGAASRSHEATIIQKRTPAQSFGDVSAHAIPCPHDLPAHRRFGKAVPIANCLPDVVSKFLSEQVNVQVFEIPTAFLTTRSHKTALCRRTQSIRVPLGE